MKNKTTIIEVIKSYENKFDIILQNLMTSLFANSHCYKKQLIFVRDSSLANRIKMTKK